MKKIIKGTNLLMLTAILIGLFLWYVIPHFKEQSPVTYNLELLYDDIYITTYHVSSNVPASNYDVAEYCINGSVYNMTGTVYINYTDDNPFVVITGTKLIHGTVATFYVPRDGVKRETNVGLR